VPQLLLNILEGFWGVLGEMAPYLLLGFALAGGLSVLISARTVERHLGGRGIWPVVKAAAFGIPLPLCSCGVIPVGASLRRHGASRGATTSFLIATPQDGVDSVFVTLSLLGGTFAVFRPLVALVSGVLGGSAVAAVTGNDAEGGRQPETCREACCEPGGGGKLRRALAYGFGTLPQDIGRALLIGLVVAALISAIVPDSYFADYLGGGVLAMLVMMVLGIPVYVCATASVPVAAMMIVKGVSPGAALVFLMTGPATNAAAIATIWKVMGRRTALVYLATVAVTAVAAGLTLDYIFQVRGTSPSLDKPPWMLPEAVKWVCAVALLAVLAAGAVRARIGGHAHARKDEHEHGRERKTAAKLRVSGMTKEPRKREPMTERTDVVTFKGSPLTLLGEDVAVGSPAPEFAALAGDLSEVKLSSCRGKTAVLSFVPSLDTPVCDAQTRRFNEEAAGLGEDVVILTISMDLPFAQGRWCGAAGVERVVTLSDHRDASASTAMGVLIKELRLAARAVFVVDAQGVVRYKQIVGEVTDEPDYAAALEAVRELTTS